MLELVELSSSLANCPRKPRYCLPANLLPANKVCINDRAVVFILAGAGMAKPLIGAGPIQNLIQVAAGEPEQNAEPVHEDEQMTFHDVEELDTAGNACILGM